MRNIIISINSILPLPGDMDKRLKIIAIALAVVCVLYRK